jgi:hypothetical protein
MAAETAGRQGFDREVTTQAGRSEGRAEAGTRASGPSRPRPPSSHAVDEPPLTTRVPARPRGRSPHAAAPPCHLPRTSRRGGGRRSSSSRARAVASRAQDSYGHDPRRSKSSLELRMKCPRCGRGENEITGLMPLP